MKYLMTLAALSVGFSVTAQSDCGWNPDYDGDNQVGVADLLGLLGVFEEQDLDEDGIWDSQDDCVGVFDQCGVCNGPGVVPIIDEILYTTDSIYIDELQEWYVFDFPTDTLFIYECPLSGCIDTTAVNFNPEAEYEDGSCVYGPEECGSVSTVDFDGYTYDLVAIGDQCWFAENLRTEHYANGDAIPGNLSTSQWSSTSSGAQTVYDNDDANLAIYGRLYNWYAVDDARGLCPSGWHIPTDGEWMTLEMELGMSSSEADSIGFRGTDQGAQMKSSSSDTPSWNGTNVSGFSALPGGVRYFHGFYGNKGSGCYLWGASLNDISNTWVRSLSSDQLGINRNIAGLGAGSGFSVRCVQD